MWTAIFRVLIELPALISILEKLVGWVQSQIQMAREQKAKEDLDKAAEKAKKTKDTSDLDDLFGGKK